MAQPAAHVQHALAGGTGARRNPKRISAAELDDLLYLHAQAQFGDAPNAPPLDDVETVNIGYPLALAFDLWCAWKDHNVLPRAGGYLDQPRRWQQMIRTMNRRFNPLYERARDEHLPPDPNGRAEDGDVLSDIMGAPSPFAPTAPASWERFKGSP